MKYKFPPIFIVLIFIFANDLFSQQTDWKLIKSEDQIKVFSRASLEGSIRKELRVITEVNYTLSTIVSLFADKPSYPKWVYGCASIEILKNVSETEMYHYQITNMPWPVQNRDLIVHTTISQNPETKVVNVVANSSPDYLPVKNDYVRVSAYTAIWTLTPKLNGVVELDYYISVDPGGNIPSWLVNMAAADGPMNTIKNMRNFLPQYKDSKLGYIKD